jgi:large subunit ribosomal protein L10
MAQPVPLQFTRDHQEPKLVEFTQQMEDYPVTGILDMNSLPSRQLQELKKEMKDFAEIKMSRKTLMELAVEKADRKDIEQLNENQAIQPAFIFSEKDPFQLYALIKRNKTAAAASGGEEAPNDIEIPEGDTGIGPGPMLGRLQQAGLQVQIDDGSIHVQETGVIVEAGETITPEIADILNQMGIEPLEIGLDLKIAYSDGEVFTREQLDIEPEEYREKIEFASSRAFNLAVNAGYITSRTAPVVISEAARKARNLSISEGIVTAETIEDIISHASSNAKELESQLDLETVEEETEDESEVEDTETEEDSSDETEEESEDETEDSGEDEETEEEPEDESEAEEEADEKSDDSNEEEE